MIINKTHILMSFLPEHKEDAEKFFEVYDIAGFDFAKEDTTTELKVPNKNKVCRFCNLSSPKVKFDNDAHTIPEFLGNRGSISDFECDTCNKHFGRIENQLSNFIGAAPTLNRTRGKKKIPTSPSYDKKIIAKKINFYNANTAIEVGSTENSSDNISYDEERNRYTIEFITQPYIPYDVYKAFLKMAIGLLPESELKDYKFALELLQDFRNRKFVQNEILSVFTHHLSTPYTYTGIFLFKKRNSSSPAPPLSFVLFYGHVMFQIYIPFSLKYMKKLLVGPIMFPLLPPIQPTKDLKDFQYSQELEKLDSVFATTRKQHISFVPDNRDKKLVSMDPITKEMKDHVLDPHNIVKFIIIDDPDFRIPFSSPC